MEKKDIHKIEQRYSSALQTIESDNNLIKENKATILKFLRDCELGKTIKGRQKKKIGKGRLLRASSILKSMSRDWFKKPFEGVAQEDMENFISNLENGKILSSKGTPYTEETKLTIKKFIKKFYKWLLGNGLHYPEIVEWIDTSGKRAEIPALRREEIERLVERSGNIRDKAFIISLFDSGARIDEFLNIKLDDVKVKGADVKEPRPYYSELNEKDYYLIRIQFSKTLSRSISLPLSTRYLREWIKEHPGRDNVNAFLFDMTYPNVKKILRRKGQNILGKRLSPHIFRHSSMTYYANIIKNRYQLCYRYGLTMSSKEIDRYIDRAGLVEETTPEAVKADEVSRFRRDYEKMREEMDLLREKYDRTQELLEKLVLSAGVARETIRSNPGFREAVKKTAREKLIGFEKRAELP